MVNTSEIDVEWLLKLTRQAGKIARSYFGKTRVSTKPDCSWVTEADLAVEDYLRREIASAHPHDAILGEEGEDPYPRSERVWAIDPLDGTRCFNHGLPVWGVSVGMLQKGTPILGAFYLPMLDDLYHTDGTGTFLNGTLLAPPDPPIGPNAILLVNESVLVDYKIDFPGKIHSLGSTAAHICYIMRGSAVGAIGQAHIWDYAACAAMLRILNVPFRFLSGAAVEFANLYDGRRVPEPTLVCPPGRFDTVKHILEAGSPE